MSSSPSAADHVDDPVHPAITPTRIRQLFDMLQTRMPEVWPHWPADDEFEIIVGAILTQNTTWVNTEKAIDNLRKANLLEAEPLLATDEQTLQALIRPSGFITAKARYLHAISRWFVENAEAAATLSTPELRHRLLAVPGIGPETADVLCLYVFHRPVFIWDTYSRRILAAAGLGQHSNYEKARRALGQTMDAANLSAEEHKRFHILILEAGKRLRRGEAEWLVAG